MSHKEKNLHFRFQNIFFSDLKDNYNDIKTFLRGLQEAFSKFLDLQKVMMPLLHIKLSLINQFVLDKSSTAFKYLQDLTLSLLALHLAPLGPVALLD